MSFGGGSPILEFPNPSFFFSEKLGDLNRVEGGAFEELVADDPEVESVGAGEILADAPAEDLILTCCIGGHRKAIARSILEDTNPRRRS